MADRSLLQLLVEEAPVEAFDEPVRSARARGADANEIARLEAETARALRVRTVLAERRRREAELAALYETAGDLTSLRNVEAVLQALVNRARRLLGTDVAYLTLFDEERGDTYMRVTDGIASESFRSLRLGMGSGLGGLVASTRGPHATSNYLADERYAHTPDVDEAVGGEGIVAILGVPLMFAGRVIGVLFTANRHERPFAPEEVALLSSLAAHAAVAIENARLFGEAQEALAELAAANRLVQEHSEAVERAATAHEQLTALVLRGGGVEGLVSALAGVLDASLLLVDADGRPLAAVGEPPEPAALGEAPAAARQAGRTVRHEVEGRACWLAPVLAGSEQLGVLVLSGCDVVAPVDLRILERAAQITALLLLGQRSVDAAEQRIRGALLDDLLAAPRRDPDTLRRRAHRLGADLDAAHVVVVVAVDDADRHRTAAAAAALARDEGGLAGEHNAETVLLLPHPEPGDTARLVSERLGRVLGAPVTAGAAGPAAGPEALAGAYTEAQGCLRVLQALGTPGAAGSAGELGVYGLLLREAGRDGLERFVDRRLGPVLAYDERRRTDLFGTLEAYFAAGGNHARAAAALHIHGNTLYQRLDRIASLVGGDWRDPENALLLHLAVRIHRLRVTLR